MVPRCTSTSTLPARSTSRVFFLRMSTLWCTTSFGLPSNSRRSMPTTLVVRCSSRVTSRPSLPQMPVISTAMGSFLSPEDVFAPRQAVLNHRVHGLAHHVDLGFHLGVVVVGV